MAAPDRRAELLGWIAASRRLQFRLGIGLGIAAVAAIVATTIDGTIGGISLAMVAIVTVCAFWVTGSHILDWRNRLEALARKERSERTERKERKQ
jgi:type IV secretory pathway VirB2 component (pilin)